jgi:hypothetical protein
MEKNSEELVLTVKPGTKVKVVEAKNDVDLKGRDLHISAPLVLKIAINRVHDKDIHAPISAITMCG